MRTNLKTMREPYDRVYRRGTAPRGLLWQLAGPRCLAFAAALAIAVCLAYASAGAQTPEKPAPAAEGAPAKAAEAANPPGPPATIDGFRSGAFGMTEEQLRRAIEKDFAGTAAKLKKTVHPSEKTTVLSLPVSDLLPNTGPAQLLYIIGYKSKKLIQVNVVWRSEGSKESDETVVGTANSLRDYFAAQSYKPGSQVTNRQLGDNAIVVFRGADARDRMVVLVLNGAASPEQKEKTPRPPSLSLELSYIADAANPDVFRIPKGQF